MFLRDMISNGTWVNGNKVGKDRMWPLEHNAEICFTMPSNFLKQSKLHQDPVFVEDHLPRTSETDLCAVLQWPHPVLDNLVPVHPGFFCLKIHKYIYYYYQS